MSALESLVGSLGSGDDNDGDILSVSGTVSSFNNLTSDDPIDSGDFSHRLPFHLTDVQLTLTGGPASSMGGNSSPYTQPSRQRCHCPSCGRMLSQRRNLKQHLITTHKMTPDEATVIVKRYNFELLIDEPIIQPLPQAPFPALPPLPSPPLPLLPSLPPISSPSVFLPPRSPLSS